MLQDLGAYEEGAELLRKALASDEASFEPGHPAIAVKQSNLALVLKELGEFEEAETLARSAYESFERKFGPEHPQTLKTKKNWGAMEKLRRSEGK